MHVLPQLLTGIMRARKPLVSPPYDPIEITVRQAGHGDETALLRLAALDSVAALAGDVLLAEAGGKPTAAISLTDGRVVADPFERTADLVELLRTRARQLPSAAPVRAGRRRLAALGQAS